MKEQTNKLIALPMFIKEQDDEIKPCPFCGYKATVQKPASYSYFIECGRGCGTMTRIYETYDEAVKAWNNRTMRYYRSEHNGMLTDVTFYRNGRLFIYPKIRTTIARMRFNHEHHQR